MNEPEEAPEPTEDAHAPAVESTGVIEIAANGRARCRACGQALEKGSLRCGETAANPFGEGTTVYWFHLRCAAERRPECFLSALTKSELPDAAKLAHNWDELRLVAEFGALHPRAARFAGSGVAPSGRARCRACKDLIEKGALRMELSIFHDGRFDPMGYLHVRCIPVYVEARVPWARFIHLCAPLSPEQRDVIQSECD